MDDHYSYINYFNNLYNTLAQVHDDFYRERANRLHENNSSKDFLKDYGLLLAQYEKVYQALLKTEQYQQMFAECINSYLKEFASINK